MTKIYICFVIILHPYPCPVETEKTPGGLSARDGVAKGGRLVDSYFIILKTISQLWADAPAHVREFDQKLLKSPHEEDNGKVIGVY